MRTATAAGREQAARERLQLCANPLELRAFLFPTLKVFVPIWDLLPFNPVDFPSELLGLQ